MCRNRFWWRYLSGTAWLILLHLVRLPRRKAFLTCTAALLEDLTWHEERETFTVGDPLVPNKDCDTVGVLVCIKMHTLMFAFMHILPCGGTPASLLNSEHISARACAYTCCASVHPDVSVMFYNDRFTPSRDSTNAHTLRLLSPFPPSPYPRFFYSTRLAWAGDKVSGGVSVCVCLPLTRVTHILSGVTHKDWVQIELDWSVCTI